MDFRFAAHDPRTGEFLRIMPRPVSVQIGDTFGTRGTLVLSYAGSPEIETFLEVRVQVSFGGEWEQVGPALLRLGGSHEDTDESGMRTVEFVSREWVLGKARVGEGELPLVDGKRPFYQASPGEIMRALLLEAQDRGAAQGIELGEFDAATDSAGAPWSKVATIYYSPGLPVGSVLENLVDQGMCDYRMNGRTLELFEPDTAMGRDLTVGDPVRIHGAVTEAPVAYTLEDLTTSALLIGEEGFQVEVANPSAPRDYGELEVTIEQGGVNSEATARTMIDAELQRGSREIREITRSQAAAHARYLPFRDYRVGDYVEALDNGRWERYRVREVQIVRDGDGWTVHTVLNDRLQELLLKLAKRTSGIVNGSKGSGGDGTPPAPAPRPGLEPAAPQGLVVDQQVYIDGAGDARGLVTAGWGEVTESTRGQRIDLAGYELWRRDNETYAPWRMVARTDGDTEATDAPVWLTRSDGSAAEYQWRVRAVAQQSGREGAWSEPVTLTMTQDTTPPPLPSAPVVSTGFRIVSAEWDGLTADGTEMPSDFARVRVYIGTAESMSDARQVGSLPYPGTWNSETMPAGVTVWVAFTAVDRVGNESAMTAAVSVTPQALVDEESISAEVERIGDEIEAAAVETAQELGALDGKLQTAQQELVVVGENIGQLETDLAAESDAREQLATDVQGTFAELDTRLDSFGDDEALADLRADLQAARATADSASAAAAAADQAASAASQAALEAAGIAASKGRVIIQDTEPQGADRNAANIWIKPVEDDPETEVEERAVTYVYLEASDEWIPTTSDELAQAAQNALDAREAAQQARQRAETAISNAATAQAAAEAAQQTADQATLDARSAHNEAVAAAEAARAAIERGDSLLVNGSFEVVGEDGSVPGWPNKANHGNRSRVYEFSAHTGKNVVRLDASTANVYPETDPYPVQPGQILHFRGWFRPYGVQDTRVGLMVRELGASQEPLRIAYVDRANDSGTLTANAWNLLEGDHEVSADTRYLTFAPHISGSTATIYHADDLQVVDVTDARRAQARADEAYAEAAKKLDGDEVDARIIASANGKNSITTSFNPPSGDPVRPGDTWWQVDTDHQIFGQWVASTANQWVAREIRSEVIANLDVHKLTGSSGDFETFFAENLTANDAAVEKLWTDQLVGKTAAFNRLTIAPGNIWPDPYFQQQDMWPESGGGRVRFTSPSEAVNGSCLALYTAEGSSTYSYFGSANYRGIQLEAGAKYRLRFMARFGGSSALTYVRVYLRGDTSDGTVVSNTVNVQRTPGTSYQHGWLEAEITAPTTLAGLATVGLWVPSTDTAATVEISGFEMVRKAGAVLIEDGAISADKVNAESVAGAVGKFVEAEVGNLKATTGTVGTAVISKLWADGIAARSVAASRLTVGPSNMIAGVQTWSLPTLDRETDAWRSFGRNASDPSRWSQGANTYTVEQPLEFVAGVTYRFTMDVRGSISGTRYYVQLSKGDLDGELVSGNIPLESNSAGYIVSDEIVSGTNTWNTVTTEFTPTESGVGVLRIYTNHNRGTSTATTYQWFRNPVMVPMVGATVIEDGAVTSAKVRASAITAGKIATGAITAGKIAANAVRADEIAAGAIDGKIITGATVRTAASGARVQLNTLGIRAYDAAGATTFSVHSQTGAVFARGDFEQRNSYGSVTLGPQPYSSSTSSPGLAFDVPGQSWWGPGGLYARDVGGLPATRMQGFVNGETDGSSMSLAPGGTTTSATTYFRRGHSSGQMSILSFEANRRVFLETDAANVYVRSRNANNTATNSGLILYTNGEAELSGSNGNRVRANSSGITMNGVIGRTITGAKSQVVVGNGGIIGVDGSSRRWKTSIEHVDPATYEDGLLEIDYASWLSRDDVRLAAEFKAWRAENPMCPTPPEYGYVDEEPIRQFGVIAEEVHATGVPGLVGYGEDGEPETVDRANFGIALVPIVKRLRDRVAELEAKIGELDG